MDASLVPPEVVAPAAWRRIDFISDLHLSENTPEVFSAWRDYLLGTSADAVFILGDLFEAWIGDDARFEGFEARATAVLAEAASLRPMHFMVGNRDFLLGEKMLAACGIRGLDDPTVLVSFGARTLLSHGDAWCIADVDYQQFRRQVRQPAWQAQVLGLPLAQRRLMARGMRSESERKGAELGGEYADVDTPTALHWMQAANAPVLVHGHTHRPGSEPLGPGRLRHVLSDWNLDHDGPRRTEVLRWQADGWTRLSPMEATQPAA